MRTLASLTFNLANAPIRRETLHGRQYIVAPMAMLTEGVHNGSGGPLLYRADECKKAVAAWNMKPIVVYHPAINGQGVSACDPDILEKQQVGMVMNARWAGGKLRADAWIEEERANVVDNRITDALDSNKMMEVSTGLFTDNLGSGGEWGGKVYNAEATNHQPDHLAILPDQIGACSIADGAGLLQLNALSHGDLYSKLSTALREKYGSSDMEGPWITDVFDGYLIYDGSGGQLYKQTYTNTKDKVELTGESYEVTRVIDYKPVKDGPLGNAASLTELKVSGLIRNHDAAKAALTEMKVRGLTRNFTSSGQPRQVNGKFGVGGGISGSSGDDAELTPPEKGETVAAKESTKKKSTGNDDTADPAPDAGASSGPPPSASN